MDALSSATKTNLRRGARDPLRYCSGDVPLTCVTVTCNNIFIIWDLRAAACYSRGNEGNTSDLCLLFLQYYL
jgi:hypothetical protein